MEFLIFDIETIIMKTLLNESEFSGLGLTDEQAYVKYKEKLLEDSNGKSDFCPVVYHRPISVSYVHAGADYKIKKSGVFPDGDEGVIRFWEIFNSGKFKLVTYAGRIFDLPVMEFSALRLGIQSDEYWGGKFNARYRYSEEKHLDLQDLLSNSGAVFMKGGLNAVSRLIGMPGKVGEIKGANVQEAYENGRLQEIHKYCMRDSMETYGLLVCVDFMRGRIDKDTRDMCMKYCMERISELG